MVMTVWLRRGTASSTMARISIAELLERRTTRVWAHDMSRGPLAATSRCSFRSRGLKWRDEEEEALRVMRNGKGSGGSIDACSGGGRRGRWRGSGPFRGRRVRTGCSRSCRYQTDQKVAGVGVAVGCWIQRLDWAETISRLFGSVARREMVKEVAQQMAVVKEEGGRKDKKAGAMVMVEKLYYTYWIESQW